MIDKQITRWASLGYCRVLMYGRWWDLEQGTRYHVVFNREHPSLSKIVEVS